MGSFTRVVITRESAKAYYDDDGVYVIPLKDFLLNEDVLGKFDFFPINITI
ncbi:MAG: hypothetical protein J5597_06680 [Spirochaetaceae bacterium]|nr:hypothetical protein [Spirochaetaceae bacterium]